MHLEVYLLKFWHKYQKDDGTISYGGLDKKKFKYT